MLFPSLFKIQRTHERFNGAPEKLRSDFMGRGEIAATLTNRVSSLSQATYDEAVAIDYGVLLGGWKLAQ